MPTIEIDTDTQTAKRFPAWLALTVFSAVCVASIAAETKNVARTAADKWVLSVCAISMSISFLVSCGYLCARGLCSGQAPEAGSLALLLGFWAAGLPVIMNPSNELAVGGGEVVNANLYFFSWGCLATLLFLMGSMAQDMHGIDVTKTPKKLAQYFGLMASSVIVLVASSRQFGTQECALAAATGTEYCKKTKFAISMGVITFVFSGVTAYFVTKGLDAFYELIVTTFMLIMWCFGVGFITFGESPGSFIGNLYFSTWISFILAMLLFGACLADYMAKRAGGGDGGQANGGDGDQEAPSGEAPADAFPADDDQI